MPHRPSSWCIARKPRPHFDPGPLTGGNDFDDASSQTIYNRLVEFIPGTTEVAPALAESWESPRMASPTPSSSGPGVMFHTTSYFTPTRDLNADDVIFSFERQYKEDNPWFNYLEGMTWDYFQGMDMPKYIASIEKVDDLTVKLTLTEPNARCWRTWRWISPRSSPRNTPTSSKPRATTPPSRPSRSVRSVPAGRLSARNRHPLFAFADYWEGKQPIDDLIFRHHHRRLGARAASAGR